MAKKAIKMKLRFKREMQFNAIDLFCWLIFSSACYFVAFCEIVSTLLASCHHFHCIGCTLNFFLHWWLKGVLVVGKIHKLRLTTTAGHNKINAFWGRNTTQSNTVIEKKLPISVRTLMEKKLSTQRIKQQQILNQFHYQFTICSMLFTHFL